MTEPTALFALLEQLNLKLVAHDMWPRMELAVDQFSKSGLESLASHEQKGAAVSHILMSIQKNAQLCGRFQLPPFNWSIE